MKTRSLKLALLVAIALFAVSVLALFAPVALAAEGDVATVQGVGSYATLQEAVVAAEGGAYNKVVLVSDVEISETLEISGTVVLDLNGKKITPSANWASGDSMVAIKRGGNLVIMDEVGGGQINTGENASIYAAVKLTVKGENDATHKAALTVHGGELVGYYYGITGNGHRHNTSVLVDGGKVVALHGTGIFNPQNGTVTISDEAYIEGETGIEMRAGTLLVNGGTIVATGKYEVSANGSGTTVVGAAIAISQHATNQPVVATVTDGQLYGEKALCEVDTANDGETDVTLAVKGGLFEGEVYSQNETAFITGGEFTGTMDTTYVGSTASVLLYNAKIGTTYYPTFAEAYEAATEGQTIVLFNTLALDVATTFTKTVTIDLNGNTLDINAAALYVLEGHLTIANGKIDVSGVVANGDCIIGVGNYSKDGALTLNNVEVFGDGYSSAYAVFYVYGESELYLNNCKVSLANDTASAGGAFKSETATGATIVFTESEVSLKDAKIGFLNGTVTFESSSLTIEGGKNAINGSVLTISNSEVEIFGSPERGITVTNGAVTITNSTVKVYDMAEADIRFKSNDEIKVEDNSTLDAELVVVDKYEEKSVEELIVPDATATVPTFEVVVDGIAYKTVAEGLAQVKAGSFVELLTDYTTDATTVINASFTLVGNDHTFTSSARKTFEIFNATDSDINVTFSNVNVVNTYQTTYDGRCIDTRNDHINLTVTNCTLTTTNVNAGSQPLTIGGSDQDGVNVVLTGTTIVAGDETAGKYGYAIITFVKTNFTIDDCDVTGYAALYVNENDASGTTATITNSRLNGINNYSDVEANSFGAIVVYATNVTVNVSNTQVTVTEGLQNAAYKFVSYSETSSPLANNKVTVANDVTVNSQPVQNQGLSGFEVKSQASTTYYVSFDQALENAVDGDQILFGKDVVIDTETVISKNVTLDFNGYKMTLTGTPLKIKANVTFKNGTLDITGCVNTALHLVYVGVGSTPGTLNLEEIDVVGNGYQTDYSIFFMGNKGTLNLTKCTVNVSEDASSRGGVFKADGGTSEATLNITESTLNFKNADIGFLNAVVTLTDSKLTIEGGRNAINGSALTLVRSEVEIFGSNERGITLDRGDVVIVDSKVNIHDMAEASIRFKKDHSLEIKGASEVSVETIVIDSATGADLEDLVTVEDTATFTKFVLMVDEVCYTSIDAIGPNVQDGSVIVLLDDLTSDTTFQIYNYNLTVDGNGHTYTSTAPINFEIYNLASTVMNVTFKDITLVNASGIVNNSRAIVVKSDNVVLNVTNSTVTSATANCALIHVSAGAATNVAVNVTGSTLTAGSDAGYGYALYLSSATTLNVTDTNVTAWAALYASQSDGSNSVVTFTECTINSVNVHSGATNSFGALVVYADNVEVVLNKTAVNVTAAGAAQYFVLFGLADVYEATNSNVTTNECTVTGATALANAGVQVATATGYVYYTSLADVVAQDGATVTLMGDTTSEFVVSNCVSVTLDLNGYTLTNANGVKATGVDSKLTVVDSSADKTGTISGKYAVNAVDGGAVVIEQANVVSTMYAIYVNDGSVVMNGGYATSQLGYGVVLFGSDATGASFTLNDGVIEGSVGLTATGDNQYDNCAVTINGGAITAGNDQIAVYWASNGLLKVTGGTITGATAVYVKSGSVDITGGKFVATGAQYTYRYVANGAVATGDALVIENVTQDSYEGIVAATVTAGHFVSANANPIATYAYVAGEEVVHFVQVGVTSNKALLSKVVAVGFISNPTTDSEGNAIYTVEKDRVAQVGTVVYGTIEEALAAAIESGETLVMLKNADIGDQTVVVPAGKTFTIDLNGCVLSGSTDQRNHTMIINNGTFVVEDNSALSDGEIRYTFTGEGDASYGTGNYTVSNRGNMTVNSGTVNNATGAMTHMRDAIDNNSTVRDAILVINGGEVKCDSYMAIRQFANSTTHKNDVVINGGKVGKIFVQGPNSNENLATLTVAGGEVTGLLVSFEGDTTNLEFDIKASCLTSDYLHFYVDDNHYVYEDKVADKYVVLEKSQVAKVGEGYYTFEQALVKAAETGEEVVLIGDATVANQLVVNYAQAVTVNLSGKTLTLTGAPVKVKSDLTIKNGTVSVTGAVATEQAFIFAGYTTPATLTLEEVDFVGNGYTTDYSVFYVEGYSTLNIIKSTVTLENDLAAGGGVFKSDEITSTINIVESTVNFKDADIGFMNAIVNVTDSTMTIEGGKNAINGSILTITGSEVEIFGSNERGITVTHGPVTIVDSKVDIHDMAEASIRFKSDEAFEIKGMSQVTAETIVIDSAANAVLEDLVVVEETATFTEFVLTVDGFVYTDFSEGMAAVVDGSVIVLHVDLVVPTMIVLDKAVTIQGQDHVIEVADAVALALFNNAQINDLTIKNTSTQEGTIAVLVGVQAAVKFNNVDLQVQTSGTALSVIADGCMVELSESTLSATVAVVISSNNMLQASKTEFNCAVAVAATADNATVLLDECTITATAPENAACAAVMVFANNVNVAVQNSTVNLVAPATGTQNLVAYGAGITSSMVGLSKTTVTGASDEQAAASVKAVCSDGTVLYTSDLAYLYNMTSVTEITSVDVTLYQDQNVGDNALVIPTTQTWTLNLNGKTVSGQGTVAGVSMITNTGTLNIVGEGTITYEYVGAPDTSYGKGNSTISNGGTLTVTNATIENTSAKMSHAMYTIDNNSSARTATLTLVDATVVGENNFTVRLFANSEVNDNVVTVKGNTYILTVGGYYGIQVFLPGSNQAAAPKATINIESGKIENAQDNYFATMTYSCGNSFENVTYNISGGEFIGWVGVGMSEKAVGATETLNVTGGEFSTLSIYFFGDETTVTTNNYNVTAGHYKYAPSDIVVAEGHVIAQNADYTYNVVTYLAYVQDYVSEDAKVLLDEYKDQMIADGFYSEAGKATLEQMWLDACAQLDLATTEKEVEVIVTETKLVYTQVMNKWDEATAQSAALNSVYQYAATKGLAVSEIPASVLDAISAAATQLNVNTATRNAMVAIEEVAFAKQVAVAVKEVTDLANKVGVTVDLTVVQGATNESELTAAVYDAKGQIATKFADVQEQAIDSLYGKNNINAAHVTSSMVASILSAETVAEVEMAVAFAENEIAQLKAYKAKIDNIETSLETVIDVANTAAANAEAAATKAAEAATKAEQAGAAATAAKTAAEEAKAAAEAATAAANEVKVAVAAAQAAAEEAKAAAESGKATSEELAQVVATAEAAAKAAETAAKAAEVAAKAAADKAQTAEVKTYATTAVAQLEEWITNYLEELAGSVVASTSASANFRADLEATLEGKYSAENKALILSYYDQAISAINIASTKEEVDYAMQTFKTNVALVDALAMAGATDNSDIVTWLVVIAVIEVLLAVAVVCLVLKKKTTITVELPVEECDECEEQATETEQAPQATEVSQAVDEEVVEVAETVEESAEAVAEETVEEVVEETTQDAETEETEEYEEADEECDECEDDADESEEPAEEATESGEEDPFASLQNRKSKTFDQRLAEADEQTRATYEEIKAEFLSHKKVKERLSKKFVSFRRGRTLLAKVVLRGKSLNVFLALNPDEYSETVYHQKNKGDKKAYELVPMMVRVRSPRSIKKAKRLIAEVISKNTPQA